MTARYDAEIGHYGTEVTQRRMKRVFRLPDSSLEWDTVEHRLGPDGQLHVVIRLVPVRPYKCDLTVEELELVPVSSGRTTDDADSVMMANGDDSVESELGGGDQ